MTRHAIAWAHDGQEAAWLEAPKQRAWYGARFDPVGCAVSMVVSGARLVTRFTASAAVASDAGAGWSVSRRKVASGEALLLGAHCYQRAVTADIREVTVVLNDATLGEDGTHKGALYFSDLRITFAEGWNEFHLDRPTVDPLETQFFPTQAQLTRRFVIYRGKNRDAAYAHLKHPPRPPIRSFGPSRIALTPGVTIAEENRVLEILATGKPRIPFAGAGELGFYSRALGVWMPLGDSKAYAHGGEDVFPVPRLGSPLWHQIRSDAIAERQRATALRADGRPIEAHEWRSDFEYRLDRGSHPIFRLPPFRIAQGEQWVERKWNAGACAYEADIATRQGERGFSAYDPHHGCRAILDALGHYYLTGCPANRLRVQLAAQDYMTSFRLTKVGNENQGEGWVMHSLHQLIGAARKSPGGGGRIQRELAWISWTVAHAIAITPPSDPMRARMQEWLRTFFEYLGLVRLKNGMFYAGWPTWSDDNIPWTLDSLRANGWTGRALEADEGEAPIFQTGLLIAGIDEAAYAIGFDAGDFIETCAGWVYGRPDLWVQDAYDPMGRGPAWYSRVAKGAAIDMENVVGVGNAHTIHSRDTLARAYRRSGDMHYLDLALRVSRAIPRIDGEDAELALRRVYRNSTDPWAATLKNVVAA